MEAHSAYIGVGGNFWTMREILLSVVVIGLVGCSGPLDKKILEPMTIEELRSLMDKDSLFESTYREIQFIRDSILKTELDRAKWADLTYKQIHDLNKFAIDTSTHHALIRNLRNEWQQKFGDYSKEIDSISNYWKMFKKEKSIAQYLTIEVVKIDKEYYSYGKEIKKINLGFKLTPQMGQIDQVRFGYSITPKLFGSSTSGWSIMNQSWCISTKPFSKATTRYWEVNYKNERILNSMSLSELLRDYNVDIELDEVMIDGKTLNDENLDIPESIQGHWRYEDDEQMSNFYVADIVREFLNMDYKEEFEFIIEGRNKSLRDRDPVAYEFKNLWRKNKR